MEAHVPQGDRRCCLLERDPQPGGVAERAVGVGEAVEEVGVLPLGTGGDDLAGAGEDVHLEDRLVGQPAAEGRRLDAQTGHRSPERDGLELGDDERHEAVGQGGVDEPLVGAHALDVRRARDRVDRDDAVETRHVETRGGRGRPGAEEVGRPLGQPHRRRPAGWRGSCGPAARRPRRGLPPARRARPRASRTASPRRPPRTPTLTRHADGVADPHLSGVAHRGVHPGAGARGAGDLELDASRPAGRRRRRPPAARP